MQRPLQRPLQQPLRTRLRAAVGVLAAAALSTTMLGVPAPSGAGTQDASQAPAGAAYRNAKLPIGKRVDDLLGRMTLAEKIGQMAQAERADVDADPSLITTYGLGSLLSGGGSTPTPNTPEQWADMVDRFQRAALDTRLGIPLIYGVDSVHGHANLMGATVFPHNIGLGATRDPRLVERIGEITAQETRATGPQWAFAPCLCVARDDRWGRTYESFGEDPDLVTSMTTAIRGLQGRPGQLDDTDHVLASAKHFAGDGLTTYDESLAGTGAYPIDQGVAEVDRETFDELALAPYWPAVRKYDVGSVMPSFSSVDWTEDGLGDPIKMHANGELITETLKGDMRFDGIVISDWRAIRQLPGTYRDQVEASVLAGVDMFMEPIQAPNNPSGWDEFIPTLTDLVDSGEVPVSRIDDAVRRILTKKFELGLFEHPFTDRTHIDDIGSDRHRRVARQAVAESQVLLKNERRAVPLPRRKPVYVAGAKADSIGDQAGGWTITWQGGSTHQVPGNTILDGVRGEATHVTWSADGSRPVPKGASAVVVVGETPYAEGFGDVGGPQWAWDPADNGVPRPPQTMELTQADQDLVTSVCAKVETCVVVLVSGRPLVLEPSLLSQVDAVQAAWLPGSQGEGVTDVLFGRKPYTGRLPVSWPRAVSQEPINVGDADYDPLYPYGWGLRARR
ncbi:glycoside hydrolase family 3 protein [Microbacterium sp. ARD31]|uniref:glycoside hydrolase family 3 protein n=1 Tax=Microbacterium sp. ARD31 TaxID=2962576 RepID=UPI0028827486|nr:glycoside hydrolase family 3 protein [Microbacterium sp. ARD31]MDT0183872.1 glycoside hydrolase family 3 protein [Microbacterium sp. ARD31]